MKMVGSGLLDILNKQYACTCTCIDKATLSILLHVGRTRDESILMDSLFAFLCLGCELHVLKKVQHYCPLVN